MALLLTTSNLLRKVSILLIKMKRTTTLSCPSEADTLKSFLETSKAPLGVLVALGVIITCNNEGYLV